MGGFVEALGLAPPDRIQCLLPQQQVFWMHFDWADDRSGSQL